MTLLTYLLSIGAVVLLMAAAVRIRARVRAHVHRRRGLDDADVERILATGVFVSDEDEPLDLDHVHEEERRFWEEAQWDEPDWD